MTSTQERVIHTWCETVLVAAIKADTTRIIDRHNNHRNCSTHLIIRTRDLLFFGPSDKAVLQVITLDGRSLGAQGLGWWQWRCQENAR